MSNFTCHCGKTLRVSGKRAHEKTSNHLSKKFARNNSYADIDINIESEGFVYIGYVGHLIEKRITFKFGESQRTHERFEEHRRAFDHFELIKIVQTNYPHALHQLFESELKKRGINRKHKTMRELFVLDSQNEITPILQILDTLSSQLNDSRRPSQLVLMREELKIIEATNRGKELDNRGKELDLKILHASVDKMMLDD